MKKVLIVLLALFGLFCLAAVMILVGLAALAAVSAERLPAQAILEIDFDRGVVETVPDDPLAKLVGEPVLELHELVRALDQAAEDRHVVGLFARVGGSPLGLAHYQEIRDAVTRFRESGKPAVAFAESFGEFGPGNGGYYLATAFDAIYLQPSGNVGLTGLIYESPFVRGLLDKIEIRPEIGQRYEYKNAVNFYTERGFTEPHRRALQELMDSQFSQIVRGIAEARAMDEAHVRELVDAGPYIGAAAVEAGLVDQLAYRDEALDSVRERAESDAEPLDVRDYLRQARHPARRGATIALIHGHGTILQGRSGYSPVDGSMTLGADTVVEAFRAAVDDRRVKAILFRVDSPGGSFVASDTIWRETVRARDAGKPVIVSMGNLAGSGGYYVAMDADKIVAQPGTITASIGVYGGKFYTRDLWTKLGVSWDDVSTSERSRMWSAHYDWGAGQASFEAMLDRVYTDFTGKVAAGRELDLEHVQRIARGRIWTGEDALEIGLVDALGGMDVALRLAREAAGLDADEPVRLKRFPPPRSLWEVVFERSAADGAAASTARVLASLRPAARMLQQLGLLDSGHVLMMPAVPVQIP